MDNERRIGRYLNDTFTPLQGKKHFFGIGINDYAYWRSLNNAVKDLDDIVTLLIDKYDFDQNTIVLLKNSQATRKNIVNTLHRYTTDPSVVKEEDSLLIYFSGHGILDSNNDGYWVPYESAENDIDSFIPIDTIHRQIKHLKCRHVLLISDSCFSGSLINDGRDIQTDMLTAIDLEQRKSRWIMTSGGRDQAVSDGSGNNSPFAEAILSELRHNSKPKLIVDELALRVRSTTRGNAKQMPQVERIFGAGDLGGRFIFNLRQLPVQEILKPIEAPAHATTRTAEAKTPKPEQQEILIKVTAFQLISTFMDILKNHSYEAAALNTIPLIHRSLLSGGQLKADFKANSLKTAYDKAHLYQSPVVIQMGKPTGRLSIGILTDKEEGVEWLFSIAKIEEKGGLPAYIRVFFPKNDQSPTLTGVSL